MCVRVYVYMCVRECLCVCVCVRACVLAMCNKAQAQIISYREFKLWTFLQGTESRVATFLAGNKSAIYTDKIDIWKHHVLIP